MRRGITGNNQFNIADPNRLASANIQFDHGVVFVGGMFCINLCLVIAECSEAFFRIIDHLVNFFWQIFTIDREIFADESTDLFFKFAVNSNNCCANLMTFDIDITVSAREHHQQENRPYQPMYNSVDIRANFLRERGQIQFGRLAGLRLNIASNVPSYNRAKTFEWIDAGDQSDYSVLQIRFR